MFNSIFDVLDRATHTKTVHVLVHMCALASMRADFFVAIAVIVVQTSFFFFGGELITHSPLRLNEFNINAIESVTVRENVNHSTRTWINSMLYIHQGGPHSNQYKNCTKKPLWMFAEILDLRLRFLAVAQKWKKNSDVRLIRLSIQHTEIHNDTDQFLTLTSLYCAAFLVDSLFFNVSHILVAKGFFLCLAAGFVFPAESRMVMLLLKTNMLGPIIYIAKFCSAIENGHLLF